MADTFLTASLTTASATIWSSTVTATKDYSVVTFKNANASAGNVYLHAEGLNATDEYMVLEPGDAIPLRLNDGITAVTAKSVSTSTLNWLPQTASKRIPVVANR